MYEKMKNVAVIPARGNSKGVPGKNKKLLDGIPLVVWTMLSAAKSSAIDTVVVSTEDDDIKKIIMDWAPTIDPGKTKIILLNRPSDLSQDWVQCDDIAHHVLRVLCNNGANPDKLVVLQPTSPFRTHEQITEAVKLHKEGGSLMSGRYLDGFFWMENDGEVTPVNQDLGRARRGRQWTIEKRRVFKEDGAIYVLDAKVFAHERISRFAPMVLYERDQSKDVDIDTVEDWKKAEVFAKEFSKFP